MIYTGEISLRTRADGEIIDITAKVQKHLTDSGITGGIVTVFVRHSTCGITTVEFEPGAIADLKRMFEELVPSNRDYAHNATWDDGNGHSHMRASLLGPSLTIPFVQRTLTLGTWQQVIYLDFDIRPRHRELVVQMIGE